MFQETKNVPVNTGESSDNLPERAFFAWRRKEHNIIATGIPRIINSTYPSLFIICSFIILNKWMGL
jgi:hypothetical protein